MPGAEGASRSFISAVILAAGDSRRMGRPKLLLPLGSRPLLQYAVDAAADSQLDEIVLVLGDRAQALSRAIRRPGRLPVRIAVNEDPGAGQSRSLQLGLRAADPGAEAAAILLGDQPGVTGRLIDRVVEAFRNGEAPVVRPVYSRSRRRVPGQGGHLLRHQVGHQLDDVEDREVLVQISQDLVSVVRRESAFAASWRRWSLPL